MPFVAALLQSAQAPAPFFRFAGFDFRPGGLTLLAAAPGAGKTSWLLALLAEATRQRVPAALLCYELTPDEIIDRLREQAAGLVVGPHEEITTEEERQQQERLIANAAGLFLDTPSARDTPERLRTRIRDAFADKKGPVLVGVDYLQRVPYVDSLGRLLGPDQGRDGVVTGVFKQMAQEEGWHIILVAALEKGSFAFEEHQRLLQTNPATALAALLGDERVAYDPDRVLVLFRSETLSCGCCYNLNMLVAKDRTGPVRRLAWRFYGRRYLPVRLEDAA